MHDLYRIVSGPLVWISFAIFIFGSLYRLIFMMVLAKKKEPVLFSYMSFYYGLRSILHWLTPFGTVKWQKNPVFTIITFTFHICLLGVPLLLFSHVILIKEAWDIGWWYISDTAADIMTILVILGAVFFLVRRIVLPEVKYLTSVSDYIILAIVAAPFITGFWTSHQWIGYNIMGIIHILAGEIMLAAIPFTRLSHMIFFPFTRGYIGSEFGAVRHVKDW